MGCERDEIILPLKEAVTEEGLLQEVEFKDLPEKIMRNFNSDNFVLQNGAKFQSPFGPVNTDIKAKKIKNFKNLSTYTFSLGKVDNKVSTNYYFDNLLIREEGNGLISLTIIRYEPSLEWQTGERDFYNFKGKITFYNTSGKVLGTINKIGEYNYNTNSKTVCTYELDHIVILYAGDGPGIRVYYYTETCTAGGGSGDSGGGGNDGGMPDPESIPSVPIEGGDFDPGGGNGNHNPPIPEIVEVKVSETEAFKNNNKINCTYEQLIQGSSIADILIDFFGDDALFDVTFNVVQNLNCNGNTNASGCTTPLGANAYRIDIDLGYINDPTTPTIFLAQTLVHEAVHANLYAAVKKLNNGISPADTSFKALYEEYRLKKGWQHEFMADHYTGLMQEAIREVHPNLNDDGFFDWYDDNADWDWDEFYEYMSYRGLDGSEGGDEYFENTDNISLYKEGAEAFSTKQPNCN